MFTGIIEEIGTVVLIEQSGSNLIININAAFAEELEIDQSVAHNGICLTIDKLEGKSYCVTAIKETI